MKSVKYEVESKNVKKAYDAILSVNTDVWLHMIELNNKISILLDNNIKDVILYDELGVES